MREKLAGYLQMGMTRESKNLLTWEIKARSAGEMPGDRIGEGAQDVGGDIFFR